MKIRASFVPFYKPLQEFSSMGTGGEPDFFDVPPKACSTTSSVDGWNAPFGVGVGSREAGSASAGGWDVCGRLWVSRGSRDVRVGAGVSSRRPGMSSGGRDVSVGVRGCPRGDRGMPCGSPGRVLSAAPGAGDAACVSCPRKRPTRCGGRRGTGRVFAWG